MTHSEMYSLVQTQLAIDLNCTVADLNGESGPFVFREAAMNPGRRTFPRAASHFDMLSMGKATVVSATPDLLPMLREQITGKSREEVFSLPFVYGHSLYFLPDQAGITELPEVPGFSYRMIEREEMALAYLHEGFHNAVSYDLNYPRPDVLALLALKGDIVVAMAGASADCEHLLQVGIDVLPEHRNMGLAAHLVTRLSSEILRRGYVPYYGTSCCNIPSQRVAHRAGFAPAWVCAYKGRFEGISTKETG